MISGRGLAARFLECPVTWIISLVNVGVFLVAWLMDGSYGESLRGTTAYRFGALWRPAIWDGQYWRLLTSVFLHWGWIHLLWNTWILFSWCRVIERSVGSAMFAFAYVTTGLGASAVSVLCHVALSAGASGAGFGMFAVVLSLLYNRAGSWEAFIGNREVRSMLVNIVLILAAGFAFFDFMDNYAHLGGLLVGIPCGLVLERRRGKYRSQWIGMAAAYSFLVLVLVVLACIPGLAIGPAGEER